MAKGKVTHKNIAKPAKINRAKNIILKAIIKLVLITTATTRETKLSRSHSLRPSIPGRLSLTKRFQGEKKVFRISTKEKDRA